MNCTTAPCILQYLEAQTSNQHDHGAKSPGQLGLYRSPWQRESQTKGTEEVELDASNQELENQRVVGLGRTLVGGYLRLPSIPMCGLWG